MLIKAAVYVLHTCLLFRNIQQTYIYTYTLHSTHLALHSTYTSTYSHNFWVTSHNSASFYQSSSHHITHPTCSLQSSSSYYIPHTHTLSQYTHLTIWPLAVSEESLFAPKSAIDHNPPVTALCSPQQSLHIYQGMDSSTYVGQPTLGNTFNNTLR